MKVPIIIIIINYCIYHYYFFIHYLLHTHISVFFYSRFLLLRDVDEKIYFHHLYTNEILYLLIDSEIVLVFLDELLLLKIIPSNY